MSKAKKLSWKDVNRAFQKAQELIRCEDECRKRVGNINKRAHKWAAQIEAQY